MKDKADLSKVLLSFLFDMLGILLPTFLFVNIALMTFGNILPFVYLQNTMKWMLPLLGIFVLGFNSMIIWRKGGTCGNVIMHMRLFDEEHHVAATKLQYERDWLEKGIPCIVLYLVFGAFGVLFYLVFVIVFQCLHPQHLSWVDICLHTHLYQSIACDDTQPVHIQI